MEHSEKLLDAKERLLMQAIERHSVIARSCGCMWYSGCQTTVAHDHVTWTSPTMAIATTLWVDLDQTYYVEAGGYHADLFAHELARSVDRVGIQLLADRAERLPGPRLGRDWADVVYEAAGDAATGRLMVVVPAHRLASMMEHPEYTCGVAGTADTLAGARVLVCLDPELTVEATDDRGPAPAAVVYRDDSLVVAARPPGMRLLPRRHPYDPRVQARMTFGLAPTPSLKSYVVR